MSCARAKIAVLGGDGIGSEVAAQGARVLAAVAEALGHSFEMEDAGKGIANPYGTILSAAMLLRHSLGLEREAALVEAAADQTAVVRNLKVLVG